MIATVGRLRRFSVASHSANVRCVIPSFALLVLAGCVDRNAPCAWAARPYVTVGESIFTSAPDMSRVTEDTVRHCAAQGFDMKTTFSKARNASLLYFLVRDVADPTAISAMIVAGASLKQRDESGVTPLHWAAWRQRNPAVIEELIRGGAEVNARANDGRTPLHWAASSNNVGTVTALMGGGADANARNEGGETPLQTADRQNNRAAADALRVGLRTAEERRQREREAAERRRREQQQAQEAEERHRREQAQAEQRRRERQVENDVGAIESPPPEAVREAQKLLAELGYDPGPVDGV